MTEEEQIQRFFDIERNIRTDVLITFFSNKGYQNIAKEIKDKGLPERIIFTDDFMGIGDKAELDMATSVISLGCRCFVVRAYNGGFPLVIPKWADEPEDRLAPPATELFGAHQDGSKEYLFGSALVNYINKNNDKC